MAATPMGQIDLPRSGFGTYSGGSDLFDAEFLVDADLFEVASVQPPLTQYVLDALPGAIGASGSDAQLTLQRLLVGEALNHSNPQTTKIYAELTDRSRQRIANDVAIGILADMEVANADDAYSPLV